MRTQFHRLADYLADLLPEVASHLGSRWEVEPRRLVAPDRRLFVVHLLPDRGSLGYASVWPGWERVGCVRVPSCLVSIVAGPKAVADSLRSKLLPLCEDPRPHLDVSLSGRGHRALGYAAPAALDTLDPDTCAGVEALLANEKSAGNGRRFSAALAEPEARGVLAHWDGVVQAGRGDPADREALERDAERLRCALEQFERARSWTEVEAHSHCRRLLDGERHVASEGPLLRNLL